MEVTIAENQSRITEIKIEKVFSTEDQTGVCPVRGILDRIGDKWSYLTILHLGQNKVLRFNELRSKIGDISQRMLTVTLRSLEEDGLVSRHVYAEVPPRVEYQLTEMGEGLLEKMIELAEWANLHKVQILKSRNRYTEN